jgi:large subunit ribosomal protein L10
MALTKAQKKKILEDLKEKIAEQKAMVFVDFTGLKVKDLTNLRKKLKAISNELRVVKKTLLRLILKDIGIEIEKKKLKGEIAIAFGFKDEISPAKIIWQFSQENPNLKILGGIIKNKFLEAEKIIELAKLPTREELLAKFTSTISAPISNLINVLKGNLRNLVYILKQVKVNV